MGLKFNEVTKLSIMNFFLNLFFLSPIAVFFFQQRGLNYFQIISLESILVLFIFLFEVPTGILADKYGRKKAIILGAILLMLEPLIFIFADNFLFFAIAFALSGIGLAFLSGTVEAIIYDHLKKQRKEKFMKKAMGTYGSASLLAMMIAPMIGSYLGRNLIPSQFILLIYLTFGTSLIAVVVSFLLKDTKEKEVKEKNPFILLKEGVRLIKGNKHLLRIILLSMFTSPFLFTLTYLSQPYFKNSGVDVAVFGVIFAVALLLSALFQKYAYKFEEWFGMKTAVFLATFLPGVFFLLMAFVFNPIWAVVLFILIKTIAGIKRPLFSQYKNIHIPSRMRATVLSLISMFVSLYLVFMRLIIGKLADINLTYSFLLMGGIVIIASVFLRIDEMHIRN